MNSSRLLEHFERIAEVPDALPRLRRFILDLAVRGKLVEQDPDDEPASELLKRMSLESERLQEFRPRRKDRRTFPIRLDDLPFAAPPQWQFVRLGDVLEMINGRAFKPTDWIESGLPIVRIQNLNNLAAPFNFCDPNKVDERHIIRDNAFLISWSGTPGTSFGAFIWTRGIAALNQHIFLCVQIGEAFAPDFLRLAINSQLDVLIGKAQGGVGLQHVTKGTLEALLLPLPPRSEQHRIVAKVDELMALCDRLEAAQNKREQRRDRLVAASLNRINQPAPSAEGEAATAFRDHARFHLDHLPRLTTRPEHIKSLRQTILNLAVRGRLVPQDPSDEPTSELLDRLKHSQRTAHADERLRPRPPIGAVMREQINFDFPASWGLASFDDIFVIVSGVTKGQKIAASESIDVPYLRVANVQRGHLDLRHIKKIAVRRVDQQRYGLKRNDILMTEGGDWDKLGRAAIWRDEITGCIHQNHVFRVRPPSSDISPEWVISYVNSPLGRAFFEDASKQTTNLASINMTQLRGCPLPLPPLAEQHRIVAKVDELMAVCDRLEAQLTTTQTDSRRLLEAVLHEALA